MSSAVSRLLRLRVLAVVVCGLLATGSLSGVALADSPVAAGRVSGFVLDQSNRPVPAALVRLEAGAVEAGRATADSMGRWSVQVPQGRYDMTVSTGPPGVTARISDVAVEADSKLNVVLAGLTLEPVRLSGRVVDGHGDPLAGVSVGFDGARAVSDAEGRFGLETQPNRSTLNVTVPLPGSAGGVPISVGDFDLTADREITLTVLLAGIDVLVRDDEGSPMSGVTVTAQPYQICSCSTGYAILPGSWASFGYGQIQAVTGADGRAHLTTIGDGVAIGANAPGKASVFDRTTVDKAQPYVVTLQPDPWAPGPPGGPEVLFSGRLLDADGAPRNDWTEVSLRGPVFRTVAPDADGSFSLPVPAGTYTLVVRTGLVEDTWPFGDEDAQHQLDFSVNNFVLDGNRTEDLRLPRTTSFPVTVLDPGGDAVADAWVEAHSDPAHPLVIHDALLPGADAVVSGTVMQQTDASGMVDLDLVPGAVLPDLSVQPPGGRGLPATITLASGATAATIHLKDAPTLRGRIRDAGGQQLWFSHGALVSDTGPGEYPFALNTDGSYAVTAPAGRYRISLDDAWEQEGQSYDWDELFVSSDPIQVSGDRTLDITIPVGLAQIRAVDSSGHRLESLQDSAGAHTTGRALIADGIKAGSSISIGGPGSYDEFDLRLIAPGLAEAEFNVDDYGHFDTPVYVAPGEDTVIAFVSGTTPTPTSPTTTTTTTIPGTQPLPGDPPASIATSPTPPRSGYWALASDGKVYNFGDATHLGNGPTGAVDLEPTPTGKGYWTLNRNGAVDAFGDAPRLGNVEPAKLAKGEEPASLSATPSGKGYWVFTNRGRAIGFGDAPFLGDMSQTKLNGPVLGSVSTPSGKGYYMVASDGGIFAFGDATFTGSMGGHKLNAPVQSLVPDADGTGYWLVASDGGIFAFDAPFRGSMGGKPLNKPVVGMVRYGDGYLMVGADGGIFNFSNLTFAGSLGDKPPTNPVVAVAALP